MINTWEGRPKVGKVFVPFVDLKIQFEANRELLEKAMLEVCVSGEFILGPQVARFEKQFADYLNVKETIGVGTGTDALRLSCQALRIGRGDEVLVPANTFVGTVVGFCELGAVPVLVDIDPETFLMDLNDAENRITKKTKAIIPVHLYGQSMDMDAVVAFAQRHHLFLIEDACQAHGAEWKGKRVGGFGDAGCFSFYPGKNLGAYGDGGLVATNNSALAKQLNLMRNYGSVKKHVHEISSTNSRLDSIQAAILNVKMNFIDEWNRKRFRAACFYVDSLRGIDAIKVPVFNHEAPDRHVFHLFVIQCDQRDQLQSYLNEKGIQSGAHYPIPIHFHKAFSYLKYSRGSFPITERLADRILSLPMFPEISDSQINIVVNAIKNFFN